MNRLTCEPKKALRTCTTDPWRALQLMFGIGAEEQGQRAAVSTRADTGSTRLERPAANGRGDSGGHPDADTDTNGGAAASDAGSVEHPINLGGVLEKVHPRASRLIEVEGGVDRTLRYLAKGLKSTPLCRICDPDVRECVLWEGFVTNSGDPMVKIVRPQKVTWTHANRAVAFLFADQSAYRAAQHVNQKKPLKMHCGNKLCVALAHINMYG